MSGNILAPVLGTDNASPMYNPLGRWQNWNMNEIYLGTIGEGKFVPKVGDLVTEINGVVVIEYVVHSVDVTTFIPVLKQKNNSLETESLTEENILFGKGPGTLSDTYRVYLDTSVSPYRLSVDRRLYIAGSMASYCKIFKGANTSTSGLVISGVYDNSGVLISENIPLELAASTLITNVAIKIVTTGFTKSDLNDGELVTVVFYDDAGAVVSKRQCILENTGFVTGTDISRKHVSHISIETPFLSVTNNKLIEYPVNLTLNSMNLIGVVHYSDGSVKRLAVDGSSFSIMGLDSYSATIVGQISQLVLKYTLSSDEYAIGVQHNEEDFVSEIYQIKTIMSNGHYAVQLFTYPVWDSSTLGYFLKWFMLDLDRSVCYNVTPNVLINTNHSSFNPTAYGTKQNLNVSINLRSVSGNYNNFNHVQNVDVTLVKPGNIRPLDGLPNWKVNQIAGQGSTYGNTVFATYNREATNLWKIRLSPLTTIQSDWITGLYLNTNPLFDPDVESGPITPTHFVVQVGQFSFEYSISQWNSVLEINQAVTNEDTLFVKFIKRTVQTDLQLSICGLSLFQVDGTGNFQ